MGDRVHIVARSEHKEIHEDGMRGFSNKTLYSAEQRDWFNNDQYLLAVWFNDNVESIYVNIDLDEWKISCADLESIGDEAFKNPVKGRTEEEMRRFIAECIRCAKLTEGECHLEWW